MHCFACIRVYGGIIRGTINGIYISIAVPVVASKFIGTDIRCADNWLVVMVKQIANVCTSIQSRRTGYQMKISE